MFTIITFVLNRNAVWYGFLVDLMCAAAILGAIL